MSLQLQIINIPDGELLAETGFKVPSSGGVLGRSTENLIALPDNSRFLSGQHARIFQEDGNWLIEDLSTNGLLINSSATPLGAGRKQTLSDGDILTLGDYRILVNLFSPEVTLNPLNEPEEAMDFSKDFLAADQSASSNKKTLELGDPFLGSGEVTGSSEVLDQQIYEPAIEKTTTSQKITDIDPEASRQHAQLKEGSEGQLINVFEEVPESIPERAEESPLEPLVEMTANSKQSDEHRPIVDRTPLTETALLKETVLLKQIVPLQTETMTQPPAMKLLYQLQQENEKLKSLLKKRDRQKNRVIQHCMTEALEQTLMDFAPAYLEKLFDDYSGGRGGLFSRRNDWKLYERHFHRVMKEQTPKLSFMARYHAAMNRFEEKRLQEKTSREKTSQEKMLQEKTQ